MRARLAAALAVALAAACLASAPPARAQDVEADEDEGGGRADTPRVVRLREEYERAKAGGGQGLPAAAARLGLALMNQRRFAEAEPLFREQLEIFRRRFGADDPRTATAAYNLGFLFRRWGRCADAVPLLEESLEIRRRRLPAGDVAIGWTQLRLGECRMIAARYAEAEALQREALAAIEREPGDKGLGLAIARVVLADTLVRLGRAAEAEALFRAAGDAREAAHGPDWVPTLEARRLQAVQLARLYRTAEAEALARDVLARSEARAPDRPLTGYASNVVGVVLMTQGRYAEAEPYFRRALALLERGVGAESVPVGETLRNLGESLARRRRLADALAIFERERAVFERLLGPDHPQIASSLTWIGNVERQLRRYDRAEAALRRALVIREKAFGADHRAVGFARAELGLLLLERGKPAEAEALIATGIAGVAAADGADSPTLARLTYNLGRTQAAQRKFAEAEATFVRALDLLQRGWSPDDETVGHAWQHLAAAQSERGALAESLESIRKASAVFRSRAERLRARPSAEDGPDVEEATARGAYYLHLRFALDARTGALAAGDVAAAARLADEGFAALQFARATGTEAAVARMAARFAAGDDALAAAVRAREELAERRRRADRRLTEATGEATRDRARDAALRAELRDLDARLAAADARLAADFPDYAGLVAVQPQAIAEVQALLRPGEVVVAWLVARAWTQIVAIAPDRVAIERVELGQQALAREVATLRRGLDPASVKADGTLPPFDAPRAHALYERLLKPVESVLAGARLVYVVPDAALQSLPVAVLLTGPPPGPVRELQDYAALPWMATRHATAVLPSVSSLRSLRRFARASAAPEPFLGVGDPALQGQRGQTRGLVATQLFAGALADVGAIRRLSPLPETAGELRAIAKTLGASNDRVWVRQRATELAVRGADLSRYRVLSFATHGLMAGEYADVGEPALVLTPPATASTEDDGLLTASEIARLRLDADWVLLSACNTAAPDGTPGAEGLSGLARAFFYAGTRSLLVSHWAVESDAAVKLTTGIFAAARRDPGIGRAEAHRQAMLALMRDRARPFNAHPLVWAPFVVVGEGAAAAR